MLTQTQMPAETGLSAWLRSSVWLPTLGMNVPVDSVLMIVDVKWPAANVVRCDSSQTPIKLRAC